MSETEVSNSPKSLSNQDGLLTSVGLGEILWDILPNGPRLGGAPANFAFHSNQVGLHGIAVSCVGKDNEGQDAERILKEQGLDTKIFYSDKVTGYVKAVLDDRGVPTYDFALDTAYDHLPLSDELLDLAKQTQVCCFGTLAQRDDGESRQAIRAFLDAMPSNSIKVFDINLRQDFFSKEVVVGGLERCNAFKCNDEELPVVCKLLGYGVMEVAEFAKFLADEYQVNTFIYTCGEKGSDIFYQGQHSFIETPKIEVVDTVGAGDSFTASFIGLIVQGVDFREAHQFAVKVAAYVCTQNGAMALFSQELKDEAKSLVAKYQA